MFPSGMLLICKVLMVKSVQDSKNPYFDPCIPPSDAFRTSPVEAGAEESTVFRVKESDAKHKLWYVMDNNLVLPEYLVEFAYVQQSENQNKIADFGD